MAYIDADFFATYNPNRSIPAGEFVVLAERASDIIDILTMQLIPQFGFSEYPASTQAAIRKAVAAQVETLYDNGGIDALTGNAAGLTGSGFTVGKFSMNGGSTAKANGGNTLKYMDGIPLSPLINGYLAMTGLLFRGMNSPLLRRNT